jgi:hypothetical protein
MDHRVSSGHAIPSASRRSNVFSRQGIPILTKNWITGDIQKTSPLGTWPFHFPWGEIRIGRHEEKVLLAGFQNIFFPRMPLILGIFLSLRHGNFIGAHAEPFSLIKGDMEGSRNGCPCGIGLPADKEGGIRIRLQAEW